MASTGNNFTRGLYFQLDPACWTDSSRFTTAGSLSDDQQTTMWRCRVGLGCTPFVVKVWIYSITKTTVFAWDEAEQPPAFWNTGYTGASIDATVWFGRKDDGTAALDDWLRTDRVCPEDCSSAFAVYAAADPNPNGRPEATVVKNQFKIRISSVNFSCDFI